MKKIILKGIVLSVVFMSSYMRSQLLLEALDSPYSGKCLEMVKDRNYGDGDHNFIYCAVKGPDGRIWLSHNLGAEYTKEGSLYFDPEAEPTGYNDWKAFGSLFQVGRKADGHELVSYHIVNEQGQDDGSWYVKRKYEVTNNKVVNPFDAGKSFIKVDTDGETWLESNENTNIHWLDGGENNPCPIGYHLPNIVEMKKLFDNTPLYSEGGLYTSVLYRFENLSIITAPSGIYDGKRTATRRVQGEPIGTSSLWLQSKRNIWGDNDAIAYTKNIGEDWQKLESVTEILFQYPELEYSSYVFDRGIRNGNHWKDIYIAPHELRNIGLEINNLAIRCIKKE